MFYFGDAALPQKNLVEEGGEHPEDLSYHLKVEIKGNTYKYYVNDKLLYEGEQERATSGYVGIGVCAASVEFENVKFTEEPGEAPAILRESTDDDLTTIITDDAIKLTAPKDGETPESKIETDEYTETVKLHEEDADVDSAEPVSEFEEAEEAKNDADSDIITSVFPVTE